MTRHAGVTVAVMALLSGMMLAVTAPSGSAAGLTSLTLTSVDPDGTPAAGPSTQAAIAADGEYATFVSPAGAAGDAVYRRDLVNGTTTLVSDTTGGASAPDISANGQLISYEQGGNVFVAVYGPAGLTVHQVTGNSEDPPYARVVTCPA
jgi:Tol biopolymer transport system component